MRIILAPAAQPQLLAGLPRSPDPSGLAIGPCGMSDSGRSSGVTSPPDFDEENLLELDLSFLETSSSSQWEKPGVGDDFFRGLRFGIGPAIALWAIIIFVIRLIL